MSHSVPSPRVAAWVLHRWREAHFQHSYLSKGGIYSFGYSQPTGKLHPLERTLKWRQHSEQKGRISVRPWLPLPCDIPKNSFFFASEAGTLPLSCTDTLCFEWSTKHLKRSKISLFSPPIPLTDIHAKCKHTPSGRNIWKQNTWCSFYSKIVSRVLSVKKSHVVPRHPLVSGKLKSLSV